MVHRVIHVLILVLLLRKLVMCILCRELVSAVLLIRIPNDFLQDILTRGISNGGLAAR
jgi:hypothetical protein